MSDQGPEPLVLFLSLLLYLGFELSFCSMDFPADITLRKTRMKFELTFKVVLLFSYQGFQLSFFAKAFIFYHITSFLSRFFLKNFFIFFRRFLLFLRCELLYINTRFLICQEVFNFLFKSVTFSFQKCVSHVQRILYYHKQAITSSTF